MYFNFFNVFSLIDFFFILLNIALLSYTSKFWLFYIINTSTIFNEFLLKISYPLILNFIPSGFVLRSF